MATIFLLVGCFLTIQWLGHCEASLEVHFADPVEDQTSLEKLKSEELMKEYLAKFDVLLTKSRNPRKVVLPIGLYRLKGRYNFGTSANLGGGGWSSHRRSLSSNSRLLHDRSHVEDSIAFRSKRWSTRKNNQKGGRKDRPNISRDLKMEIGEFAIREGAKKAALEFETKVGRKLKKKIVEKFARRFKEREERRRDRKKNSSN